MTGKERAAWLSELYAMRRRINVAIEQAEADSVRTAVPRPRQLRLINGQQDGHADSAGRST